jgi:ribosomal protein L7Ae-like RNA K-turn-binding protein
VEINLAKMAADLYWITQKILAARHVDNLAIVSLARAGTPVGVGIKRLLEREAGICVKHYSISIIRDRGIDQQALRYITGRHSPESIVFVDGWTGKGAIASELQDSMQRLQDPHLRKIPAELYVLCDLGGVSTDCGSTEDYLIPSAILNATISGLVSRTILNERIGKADFHGCLYYEELESQDLSRWFIDKLVEEVDHHLTRIKQQPPPRYQAAVVHQRMQSWLRELVSNYGVSNLNLIKPGVCESTRALLRRSARLLIVKNESDTNTAHLLHLAEKNYVPVEIREEMPFLATVLIRSFMHG